MFFLQYRLSVKFLVLPVLVSCLFFGIQVFAQTADKFELPQVECRHLRNDSFIDNLSASDNNIYLTFESKSQLASFNLETGEKNWVSDFGAEIISAPLIDSVKKKNIFLATKTFEIAGGKRISSTLLSLSSLTGLPLWQTAMTSESRIFLYNFKDKILSIDKDGNTAGLYKSDGKPIWKKSFGSPLAAEPFAAGEFLIVPFAKEIVSISSENAAASFRIETLSPVTALSYSADRLYTGDANGVIHAYSINKKKKKTLWKFQNGGAVSFINYTSRGLLVTSFDNFAYMLDIRSGNPIWKTRFAGRIALQPLVAGTTAAITSVGSSELLVLDLQTGKILNQINFDEKGFLSSPPLSAGRFLLYAVAKDVYAVSNDNGLANCASAERSERKE